MVITTSSGSEPQPSPSQAGPSRHDRSRDGHGAPRPDARTRTGRGLVVASLAIAGGIHLSVASQHPGTAHLLFFASAGTTQAALAVVLARRQPQILIRLATLVSIAVAATWVATRTGIGTDAQSVGLLDGAATAAELVTAIAAVTLMRVRPPSRRSPRPRQLAAAAIVLLAAGATTLTAPAHDHSHPESSPHVESEHPKIFGDLFDHHAFDESSHDGEHTP